MMRMHVYTTSTQVSPPKIFDQAPGTWHMALAVIQIEVLGSFPGEIARCLDLHGHIRQQITHMLMLHDRLSATRRVPLGPFEGVFIGGPGDTDCGDCSDR